jgi:two-component system, NtrC family, nitrogen regulation response regulator GlnG
MAGDKPTDTVSASVAAPLRPGSKLVVVSGADQGRILELAKGPYRIGKLETCDLPLRDGAVSRVHLELEVVDQALRVRDLESKNGSYYQGAQFTAIMIGVGASITVGATELLVVGPDEKLPLEIWPNNQFGRLLGTSVAMRRIFALLAKVAASDAPVLIRGETGTGKELIADAIHSQSPRASKPFVVGDLASISGTLMESELFGHVRGAFTGADHEREGLFGHARDGTIFLDEVGELDLTSQPRLLRALDQKQFRPVGGSTYNPIHARVIAATHRDLAVEVAEGRFREDLYHRLAVLCIEVPPLRERRDDIRALAPHFVEQAATSLGIAAPEIPPALVAVIAEHDWPGNVRQLRNVLERAVTLTAPGQPLDAATLGLVPQLGKHAVVDSSVRFHEAKSRLIDAWESDYVTQLLAKANGNVSLAARNAGMSRMSLYRLIEKHGIVSSDAENT